MPRPPVVTVMGHVDHGKTQLLDAIRNANVVAGEAGGITQHIGAYQVATEVDGEERKITFIDTPGHEAFTAMRARGAEVDRHRGAGGRGRRRRQAADDRGDRTTPRRPGCRSSSRSTRSTVEGADPTKVRGQLTEYGLVAEEYGGDTMFVDISAKQGQNIDELLEAVVLTADAELDLRANPEQDAQGVAIEAHLDKGRGAVATVLVQRGTLRVGDSIVCRRGLRPRPGDARRQRRQRRGGAARRRPVLVLGLDHRARRRRQLPRRRRRPDGPPDRRAARGAQAQRRAARASRGRRLPRGAVQGPRGGRACRSSSSSSRATCPVRSRRWRTRCSRSTSATRSTCASSTAVSVRSPRTTSTWRPASDGAVIIGFNVRARAQRAGAGRPRGRRHPLLLGHLPGDRGDRGGPQGHAQAGVRGGRSSAPRRSARSSRCRKLGNIAGSLVRSGDDQAQHQGAAHPRRRGRRRQPHRRRRCAASRTTSPRSARASSAVSASATTTSRSTTSSRRSRCGRSRAA